MATWHQSRNAAGMRGLYSPHATEWKVISDKRGECAGSISFTEESKARAYVERNGGLLVPPATVRGGGKHA
jgi:hypothetical protein